MVWLALAQAFLVSTCLAVEGELYPTAAWLDRERWRLTVSADGASGPDAPQEHASKLAGAAACDNAFVNLAEAICATEVVEGVTVQDVGRSGLVDYDLRCRLRGAKCSRVEYEPMKDKSVYAVASAYIDLRGPTGVLNKLFTDPKVQAFLSSQRPAGTKKRSPPATAAPPGAAGLGPRASCGSNPGQKPCTGIVVDARAYADFCPGLYAQLLDPAGNVLFEGRPPRSFVEMAGANATVGSNPFVLEPLQVGRCRNQVVLAQEVAENLLEMDRLWKLLRNDTIIFNVTEAQAGSLDCGCAANGGKP